MKYNKSQTGCHKRCPCRQWVNCGAYVDLTEQQKRLNKDYNTINKWYDTNFRIKYEHGENIGNG